MACIVGILFLAAFGAGSFMLWLALQDLLRNLRRRHDLVATAGQIISVHSERRFTHKYRGAQWVPTSQIANHPIIEFRNQRGELRSFKSELGDIGETSRYWPGQTVPVRYDPTDEMAPILDEGFGIWNTPLIFTAGALGFLFSAWLIWFGFGDRIWPPW